jgi:sugar phosphate isomerase/epimerase
MDMTRVSACSIALIHHPPEKAFEIIAAAGYKKVDLLEKPPHLSLFPDDCDPAVVKAAAEAHGLQIANVGTYVGGGQAGRGVQWAIHGFQGPSMGRFTSCGFSSDDPAELETELEQVRRAIDLAVFFGARSMRFFAGNDDPKTLDKSVPWFRRSAEYAAEKNMYMALENHGDGIAGQPELCVELAEKVGSPYFGMVYEPHNLMAEGGVDYRYALEVMKDHIVHVHFKDGAPTDEGYGLTLMGEGEIDFPWIMEQLDALGYDGDIALEYELHTPPPETGLKQFYEALAAMMG